MKRRDLLSSNSILFGTSIFSLEADRYDQTNSKQRGNRVKHSGMGSLRALQSAAPNSKYPQSYDTKRLYGFFWHSTVRIYCLITLMSLFPKYVPNVRGCIHTRIVLLLQSISYCPEGAFVQGASKIWCASVRHVRSSVRTSVRTSVRHAPKWTIFGTRKSR